MSSINFYRDLPATALPLAQLLQAENFHAVPPDWHVVVADVRGSTAAVAAGKHNDVNLVAAGALIAVLNAARAADVEVPFFFGGDGGTLLVPPVLLDAAMAALRAHALNVERNFGLSLHLGAVPVAEIMSAGHLPRLAKTQLPTGFAKAVLIGNGLLWAERVVKDADAKEEAKATEKLLADLMGLECRWDRIKPPADGAEIVCYLIEALDPAQQINVFRDAIQQLDAIYGAPEKRNPLSLQRLKLLVSTRKMRIEMMARFGRWKWRYFAAEMLKTAAARVLLCTRTKLSDFDGATYLEEVVANADTLTLDGRINTIISGTAAQRQRFISYLDAEELAGRLLYGHHVATESVMTCYIQTRERDHIHFVDGSDGGYTAAAGELKRKKPNPRG